MDFQDGTRDASGSHLNYGLVCSELLGYRLIRLIEEGDNTLVGQCLVDQMIGAGASTHSQVSVILVNIP